MALNSSSNVMSVLMMSCSALSNLGRCIDWRKWEGVVEAMEVRDSYKASLNSFKHSLMSLGFVARVPCRYLI